MQIGHALRHAFLKLKARVLLVCMQPQAALVAFEDILRVWPDDIHALASSAHLFAARRDFAQAVVRLRLLVAASPALAPGWFNLGFVLQQLQRHEEAGSAFTEAVALDERMDRAWYGLGLTLMHAQRFDEAIAAFKTATVLQPLSPHAWYRLAEALTALGDNDQAHRVLVHLRQFEPKVAAQLERQVSVQGHIHTASHAAP